MAISIPTAVNEKTERATGAAADRGLHKPMLMLVVSLFFLWGVANNLNDVLIAQFKKAFVLTDLQSGLVQSAFYMGYFVFAIPASLFMRRYGYKAAIVLGLLLYACGALLFYPAAELREYYFFLGALFIIASGLSFLETSANPLVAVMGPPQDAERRLNLAQAFNPLGAITGVLIGRTFILSGIEHSEQSRAALSATELAAFYDSEARAVQMPYLIIGLIVLVWVVLVLSTKFTTYHSIEQDSHAPQRRFTQLFKQRHFLFGVLAQFFYVGAQVGIWSYMIRYAQHAVPGMGEKTAASYLTASLIGFMVGRFVGTALMWRYSAAKLMALFAAANTLLMLVAMFSGGHTGLLAMAASSFFMSIMFPTIFVLGIRGLNDLTKSGASLMVMAIIGGAVLTALMGHVSDLSSINIAMGVPAFCFVVVGLFALSRARDAVSGSASR